MKPGNRQSWPTLVWPILLIGAGVILLLSNMGYLPENSWGLIGRLWPLALVLLGIDLLVGRRSRAGQLLSALLALALFTGGVMLLVASPSIPALRQLESQAELRTETIQTALEGIQTADLQISWGSGENRLGTLPANSDQLLQGEIRYYGQLIFDVQPRGTRSLVTIYTRRNGFINPMAGQANPSWQIDLNPAVRYSLNLEQGSGASHYDLRSLELENLVLESGSGPIEMWLPDGSYRGVLNVGSGNLAIHPPENSGLRLEIDQGSGNLNPGGLLIQTENDVWETRDYGQASQQIQLRVDQGSGNLSISQP
jgi:hypothetical protein